MKALYSYIDGKVIMTDGSEAPMDHAISLDSPDDWHQVIAAINNSLRQEIDHVWPSIGTHGLVSEFGETVHSEVIRRLSAPSHCTAVFLGSSRGKALRDIIETPHTGTLKVHEFCLSDKCSDWDEDIPPYVEKGQLEIHEGPIELAPFNLANVDFIFSGRGALWHAHPKALKGLFSKLLPRLDRNGACFTNFREMTLERLITYLPSGFACNCIERPDDVPVYAIRKS